MIRVRERVAIFFDKVESRTHQSDRDRCNINSIMSKFAYTGLIDHINPKEKIYEDISNIPTFQDAQNAKILSREIYDNLPNEIKENWSYDELATSENFVTEVENKIAELNKSDDSIKADSIPSADSLSK